MQRVLVTGDTGAGKTTTARRLGAKFGLPFHEVDDLAFTPGWAESPTYLADVTALADEPSWVLDTWGDLRIRAHLWQRADTVVWLDYPRRVVLPRILRRSLRRTVRREKIFNGNVESYAGWLRPDHPVWWSVRDHRPRRARMAALIAAHPHLSVVHLRDPAATERWLTS